MSGSDDDRRARDCLGQLEPRRVLGAGTLDRVGGRIRKGPSWARVFDRLGLADPYDYDAEEDPIGLGPVGVKLADRRRPAPHAQPPEEPGGSRPARPVQPPGRPQPVRLADAPKPAPPPPPASEPAPGPVDNPGDPYVDLSGADREMPAPLPLPAKDKKKTSGRLRMGPRSHATGPRVRPIPKPVEAAVLGEASLPERSPEEPEVDRRPPGPEAGLDDLFGFAQTGGRFKPRARKEEAKGDDGKE